LVGSLPDGAQVSVIGFDASPFVVFPFAPLGKETRIEVRERIGRLQGIGGTVLVPALREGQKQFKGRAEDCKEVVILTDGLLRDADADLKTEIGKLTSQKIRVSFGILLSPLGRSDVNKFLGANPGFFVVEPDVDRFSKLVSEQGQKLRG
jgi:Mg-chelatase subunit ChlD